MKNISLRNRPAMMLYPKILQHLKSFKTDFGDGFKTRRYFDSKVDLKETYNNRRNHSVPKLVEIQSQNNMRSTIDDKAGRPKRVALITDFKITLPERVQAKYQITQLDGHVMNLLPPGPYGYKGPDLKHIQKAEDDLTNWWTDRGMMEKDSKYYLKFKDNFALLAHLVIPNIVSELSDDLLRILTFFIGWTFQHDDVMDNLKDHRIQDFKRGFATVDAANKVFCEILEDKHGREFEENFPSSTRCEFPLFKPLCHTWMDFHILLNKHIPYYEVRNKPFLKYMYDYFNSYVLSHGERINSRFSEESGKYWLRFSTGFKPWMELNLLLKGVSLSPKIRKDFYFIRLRSASEDVFGFINDIFGVSKDLLNDETDTLVMFKHVEKGIPLTEAYNQTVNFLNDQIKDVILLIQVLRIRYPDNSNMEGYLRTLEDFIDGYIIWCSSCRRYGGTTSISYRKVDLSL